jgi:transcriptional antiterminator
VCDTGTLRDFHTYECDLNTHACNLNSDFDTLRVKLLYYNIYINLSCRYMYVADYRILLLNRGLIGSVLEYDSVSYAGMWNGLNGQDTHVIA